MYRDLNMMLSVHKFPWARIVPCEELMTVRRCTFMLLSVLTYIFSGIPIRMQAMRVERGYDYEDTCTVSRETMPNYDEKIKSFFEEHIHSDEVRRAQEASGEGNRGRTS